MHLPTLTLCRTCRDADPTLYDQVVSTLKAANVKAKLQHVDCMSGCEKGPTLAVRQTGKMAYLFGQIGHSDIPDIVRFLELYAGLSDGALADARPIGNLRFKAIARIP